MGMVAVLSFKYFSTSQPQAGTDCRFTQLMIPEVGFFIRVQLIKATFKPLCKISVSSSGTAAVLAMLMILTGRSGRFRSLRFD